MQNIFQPLLEYPLNIIGQLVYCIYTPSVTADALIITMTHDSIHLANVQVNQSCLPVFQ